MPRTAAALIIGNEILTGKIQERNLGYLAKQLFALGVTLRRAIVCPDEVEIIVGDLNALRRDHDVVFTSGGVGPTHDDLTMTAVARAFGRKLVRSPEIEALFREYYQNRVTESHLRMADIPEGARLLSSEEMPLPTVNVENVYVFPGIPELFQMKFPVLHDLLREDTRFQSRAVYLNADESDIAAPLGRVAAEHPGVIIGSYPRWRHPEFKVKVTFDGNGPDDLQRAIDALVAALPSDQVIKIEN